MPTYPLSTLAPTITPNGISAPSYNDILQSLVASYQIIFGSQIYISADSQDGQWIAILAQAQHESNQAAIAVFQSFAPSYSQGVGLSSLVKINGLLRQLSSKSTSQGDAVGVAGTIITNGVVEDVNGNLWSLPATVTIPIGGSISVTVTAQESGNIVAPSGSINKIASPQYGWQTFTSTINAAPGAPVESDATLRQRQGMSTALPALGIKEAIFAAVGNVSGVSRFTVYENDTGSTNGDGVPAHSLSVVTLGGVSTDIAATIAGRKPPGIQTYGTTSVTVYDSLGLPVAINYFQLSLIPIFFAITIKALPGYVSTTGNTIIAALVAFINSLAIGEDVYVTQCSAIASLIDLGIGQTFYITTFDLGLTASPSGTSNLTITFNEAASCQTNNVALTVT
jgi:uncharacterized phage protein gp47/JayE